MSNVQKHLGGPAFPIYQPDMLEDDDAGPGMSLLDYFAGQALIGLLLRNGYEHNSAAIAYDIAEKMVDESLKRARAANSS